MTEIRMNMWPYAVLNNGEEVHSADLVLARSLVDLEFQNPYRPSQKSKVRIGDLVYVVLDFHARPFPEPPVTYPVTIGCGPAKLELKSIDGDTFKAQTGLTMHKVSRGENSVGMTAKRDVHEGVDFEFIRFDYKNEQARGAPIDNFDVTKLLG